MSADTPNEQSFLKDVADHGLTVIKNDGLHRHLTFKKTNGSGHMRFDIITWPGFLAYSGDMGCYVFSRLPDMLEFFRTDSDSKYLKSKGLTLGINLSYWGEKLQAIDKGDGYKEWSKEKFKQCLRDRYDQWAESYLTPERQLSGWEEVEQDVIWPLSDGGEDHAYRSAMDFEIDGKRPFEDFYEYDTKDYSFRFVWCCYAIAWGIKQFDGAMLAARGGDK